MPESQFDPGREQPLSVVEQWMETMSNLYFDTFPEMAAAATIRARSFVDAYDAEIANSTMDDVSKAIMTGGIAKLIFAFTDHEHTEQRISSETIAEYVHWLESSEINGEAATHNSSLLARRVRNTSNVLVHVRVLMGANDALLDAPISEQLWHVASHTGDYF